MAITTETLRRIIREGQELIEEVNLYERPTDFEEEGHYVLVGIRQAGKSYMLYQKAKQMLENHSIEEIVYVNFDDERLLGMEASELDLILQSYSSVYHHRPLLFFDEIQNVDGWEHFARRLADQKYHVCITGSNAKMLSQDIQTTLGGRYISKIVTPYSFMEYIDSQGIRRGKEWQHGKTRAAVQQKMGEYLEWGGFPELMLFKNKRSWLNDLYEKILLGDVMQRNRVKNGLALRMAIKRLAESVKQPTSYRRLTNLITGTGVKTSVSSVIDYIGYAREAFIVFSLENFSSKFVEKETIRKHYFTDNGLLNIFLNNDKTALLENLCATHLHRKYGSELYFWNKNVEIDFYVPEASYAVQACYTMADSYTAEREIDALRKFYKREHPNRMVIVTYDEEATIPVSGGGVIEVVPVWKWLLEEE